MLVAPMRKIAVKIPKMVLAVVIVKNFSGSFAPAIFMHIDYILFPPTL